MATIRKRRKATKTDVLILRIEPELRKRFNCYCEWAGTSASKVIRKLMEILVDERECLMKLRWVNDANANLARVRKEQASGRAQAELAEMIDQIDLLTSARIAEGEAER
jgi:antitoxin component of RelBE/YafQ-DinJ toxin-antitoxin module